MTRVRATIGLFLNLLVLPGLGSIVSGERVGWIQTSLALLLITLHLGTAGPGQPGVLVLAVPFAALWAWALLTSVRVLREDARDRG